MAVEVCDLLSCFFFEFFDAGDHEYLAVFAAPNWDGRSPIAIAGNGPIAGVFQPFAKTAFFDMLGHPMDFVIGRKQLLFDFFHGDKPGAHRFVDQRSVRPPAKGITVAHLSVMEHFFLIF